LFQIPPSEKNFDELRSTSKLLSTAVSYDKELEAALVKECLQSDRTELLKQKLELTTPSVTGDADTPLRKVKCIKKSHCKQLELYTDFKKERSLLSTVQVRDQATGGSGQSSGVELYGGKIIRFSEDLEVQCSDNELVTKLKLGTHYDHFMIQSNKHRNKFMTVWGCKQEQYINYSEENEGNSIHRLFYEKDGRIHSAYCGDSLALDLKFNECKKYQRIWLWPNNDSDAQKFTFQSSGHIKVNGCYLDAGRESNKKEVYVWTNDDNEWKTWTKISVENTKTREIWCGQPKATAGLYIDNEDTKVTGQIENVSDEVACDEGYSISGYKCGDHLCNSFSLICKKIEVRFLLLWPPIFHIEFSHFRPIGNTRIQS
jgi:hypothetical protein